jgi:hypothetical protein
MSVNRKNQKEALKLILDTISYMSIDFNCYINRQLAIESCPCFVISNAGIIANERGSIMSNTTYNRQYLYYIDIVTDASLKQDQSFKEDIHEIIEELLLDKLQSKSTRSGNQQNWRDLVVTNIQSYFKGENIGLQSGRYYVSTFTISLDTYINFEQ